MAAGTAVGQVQTMYLVTTDALENVYETNISKGFTVNSAATYAQVNTANRALASLSTNTYSDTKLVTNISVNEQIAE